MCIFLFMICTTGVNMKCSKKHAKENLSRVFYSTFYVRNIWNVPFCLSDSWNGKTRHLKYFEHKKWSISNKKHVINFKTLKGTENEMIRFWEFKIEMQMPSHDTILLETGQFILPTVNTFLKIEFYWSRAILWWFCIFLQYGGVIYRLEKHLQTQLHL